MDDQGFGKSLINQWLQQYQPKDRESATQALREIMQEIALAGLYRAQFFEKAAFYGGTALRVFHGLDRFSEDLDFSLLQVDPHFSFEPYLQPLALEFESLGLKVSVNVKQKTHQSAVESAFLKSDTFWGELILEEILPQQLSGATQIKIKLEVDTEPPLKFDTEDLLLTRPFSCYIRCFSLSNLFAGKLHAVLFRKWKNRIKGRDWYDLEWYIKKGVPLQVQHFSERAYQSGDAAANLLSSDDILQLIDQKINQVSFDQAKQDIVRFIPDARSVALWSPAYFSDLAKKMRFQ